MGGGFGAIEVCDCVIGGGTDGGIIGGARREWMGSFEVERHKGSQSS